MDFVVTVQMMPLGIQNSPLSRTVDRSQRHMHVQMLIIAGGSLGAFYQGTRMESQRMRQ